MKRVWPWIYAALFLVCLLSGTNVFGGQDLTRTNVDWYFVTISFAVALAFPSLAMWQARDRKLTPVPRASFSRGPKSGWWADPLQWLRISSIGLVGLFAGALIGVGELSSQGAMIMYWKGGLALGFVLGELLARQAFRNDIHSLNS